MQLYEIVQRELLSTLPSMPNYSIITARTLALTIYWAYSDLSNFHLYSAVFLWVSVLSRSVVLTLCKPMDCSLPGSSVHGDSPGKNTGVDCHALLQGIFPTQGSNPGLLHCSRILYQLINQGSLLWVSSSIQFCPLCGSVYPTPQDPCKAKECHHPLPQR